MNKASEDKVEETPNDASEITLRESLAGMSKDEMTQHLKLCMKLSAENKINGKNAFGLHLIGIMRHLFKHETPDLQFASMSLQASTKIYASRVEALYKDTYQFHGHLQSIIAQGKKGAANSHDRNSDKEEMSDDEGGATKSKPQKNKHKSFLTSSESIDIQSISDRAALSKPHGNFVAIKSAFCTSRTAPKLLQVLKVESDGCVICSGTATSCLKGKTSVDEQTSNLPQKITRYIEKLKDLDMSPELTNITSCSDVFSLPHRKSPRRDDGVSEMGSFMIGDDPISPFNNTLDPPVNSIIDRFSVMDITAHDFANDIAQAITDGSTVNRLLLPPKSALKKVLRDRNTSFLGASPPKTVKKEKKPKEPFYSEDRQVDRSLFKPGGRKNDLSDVAINDWALFDVTDLCVTHNIFSSVLGRHYEEEKTESLKKDLEAFRRVTTITQEMEDNFVLSNYFHKKPLVWKKLKPENEEHLMRPSSFGMALGNSERTQSMFAGDAEHLVQSLQSMSLSNSFECDDGFDAGDPFSPVQSQEFHQPSLNGSSLDDETRLMMVPPPDLVKPINVRFSKQPMNVNTEKFKESLWDVLSKRLEKDTTVMLSDVYKGLQEIFKNDTSSGISLQMTFVMLLILANEKVLLLENISDPSDLKISKDVLEISDT